MNTYIRRDLEPVLLEMIEQFPAVALTGPRQSGKSTLLRHALPESRYLTLDDPVIRQRALDDPELLLGADKGRLIIDEIQYAPSLLSYIKMRIDGNRSEKGQFIVTGSQQFSLMKNLSESLAGRIGLLELMPFSVGEALRAGVSVENLSTFQRACLRGLFPEPTLHLRINVARWYAAYVQTYLERDIRSTYDIGNLREFERFLQLLAARCAQELNLSTLASDVGAAVNTIKKWISILEACRIIYLLPPYYRNLGKRIIKAPKVYFLDIGMACYLTGVRDTEHLLNGPMAGPLFENFCIQEALKVTLALGVSPRFYFLRTKNGLEVDLLIEGINGRLCPFEFKLSRTPRQNMAAALEQFVEEFKLLAPDTGALVSLSNQDEDLTRQVKLLPVTGFLSKVKELAYA